MSKLPVPKLTTALAAAAILLGSAGAASAFNMRQASQAVENLGQWSVMAQHCGQPESARQIRSDLLSRLESAQITEGQRERLTKVLSYWVKAITHDFERGGLHVATACPIWRSNGETGVRREFTRLQQQLG